MTGASRAAIARTEFAAVQRLLGERVRRLRAERGMSQRGLSAVAAIDERHVQRVEAGRAANPRLATLCSLADALGTSAAELIGVDGDSSERT